MKTRFVIALLLLATSSAAMAEGKASKSTEHIVTPNDGPIRLFDGKSLGGCNTWIKDTGREDPRRVFGVTDGQIHTTGDGIGGLITNDSFRDYHLVLEYRWGEKTWHDRQHAARDSGLLIHSNRADGTRAHGQAPDQVVGLPRRDHDTTASKTIPGRRFEG